MRRLSNIMAYAIDSKIGVRAGVVIAITAIVKMPYPRTLAFALGQCYLLPEKWIGSEVILVITSQSNELYRE